MRILLIGKNGQLGWELERCLQPLGEVNACDYPDINLADGNSIRAAVAECRPAVIINAGAYTAVDRAEAEPDLAEAVNGAGPGILAEEANKIGAALIHYSTDYVFDGTKGAPYVESDVPRPLNVYGLSKLHGEQAVESTGGACLVLRTSWVYSLRQGGFVNKVLEWARRQETLKIVEDQVGSPTNARMLAEATAMVLAGAGCDPAGSLRERAGLYHLAGDGAASRYEWARTILALDPKQTEHVVKALLPGKTEEFPTPAKRPLFTALDCAKFQAVFGLSLPGWKKGLELAMDLSI